MNIEAIIKELTLEEKASLCSGKNFWCTRDIERLGIPSVMLSDGPHGLRKQPEGGDHLGISESIPAVCFPTGSALAASFDTDLAEQVGRTLGNECRAEGVAVLLGPGINIKRSPLCGRNFEYYSEDPYVAGKMGAAMVRGIQSVGTSSCVKHFAANNQESFRMSGDSLVDERTLYEIYLTPFELVVKEGTPGAVMCAYNQLNGTFCAENHFLLTEELRTKWGFEGMVVTDWGAGKDPARGVAAGLDLIMPGGNDFYTRKLVEAVEKEELPEEKLDQAVRNVLKLVERSMEHPKEEAVFDRKADYEMARRTAEECAVLLKNDRQVLPLSKTEQVVFIGEFAEHPRYQGSGSSHINSAYVSSALEAAKDCCVTYCRGYRTDLHDMEKNPAIQEETARQEEMLLQQALDQAKTADKAVLFVGLPDNCETEAVDRTTMELPDNQKRLIEEVAKVQPNTIVVLHNGAPVTMPWVEDAAAILEMYLGGDGCGEAAVNLLYGQTNPSGKLAETFSVKLSDNPSYLNFPGVLGKVTYREGVYVGYRYYDKKEMEVLFPFGHGISYTSFAYGDLKLSAARISDKETVTVAVTVTNTGSCVGKEVVQLYIKPVNPMVPRPVRELKGFAKIELLPGERKEVCFSLDKRSFAYYDTRCGDFTVESGIYQIEIGASSRDIRLQEQIRVESTDVIPVVFNRNSTMYEVMNHPKGRLLLAKMKETGQKEEKKENQSSSMGAGGSAMMQHMAQEMTLSALMSFAGITEEQLDDMIASLNQ